MSSLRPDLLERGLLRYGDDPGTARGVVAAGLVPPVVFLGSIPIAYYGSPEAARWSWLSLIVLMPVVPRLASRTST